MELYDEVYDSDAVIYGVCFAEKDSTQYHVLWNNGVVGVVNVDDDSVKPTGRNLRGVPLGRLVDNLNTKPIGGATKKELRILYDWGNGPIFKNRFNPEIGECSTGIDIIDNDKALEVLNQEANTLFNQCYSFDVERRPAFDEATFESLKPRLKSLIETIIVRAEAINDGSYVIVNNEGWMDENTR
jgi:hypothetical protein